MYKFCMTLLLASLSLVGCGEENITQEDKTEEFYEPLEYRSDNGIERRGQIPIGEDSYFKRTAEKQMRQSKYGETNRSYNNEFNNDESMKIVAEVNELKEVTLTQAFSTEDHIYIAVMVNPYDRRDHTITEKIQEKIEKMTNKPITIYTNNNNWDNMKDLNARVKASDAPKELKEKVLNFFK